MAIVWKHYEGELGVFDYEDSMFCIGLYEGAPALQLRDGYNGQIDLPNGCISTRGMFFQKKLLGCYLWRFDTSSVEDMEGMFAECTLPQDFSLRKTELNLVNFDTSNVRNMKNMFNKCGASDGLDLGDKFNTANVENMSGMFSALGFPKGFPKEFRLGEKFDTSNVEDMSCMFEACRLPLGFSLGKLFNTENVRNMSEMFSHCVFPEGFSLGDGFNISDTTDTTEMFDSCRLPKSIGFLDDPEEIVQALKNNSGTGVAEGMSGASSFFA